jgi:hypothetical protein
VTLVLLSIEVSLRGCLHKKKKKTKFSIEVPVPGYTSNTYLGTSVLVVLNLVGSSTYGVGNTYSVGYLRARY